MRRLLATLLMTGSLAVPASASPGAGDVVLRGNASAHVDVTFPARFRPQLGISDFTPRVVVTTKGTYAGAYFQSLTRPGLGVGTVVVPSMAGAGGVQPISWGAADREDFSLPAGRYRVHLLTDGASTVRVTVTGARGGTYAPRSRSDVTGRVVRVDAARATIPVTFRKTTTAVLAASADADLSPAGFMSICLREGDLPCEAPGSTGVQGQYVGGPSRTSSVTAIFFYPGYASAGEHEAAYTIVAAGVPRGLWAFALTLG